MAASVVFVYPLHHVAKHPLFVMTSMGRAGHPRFTTGTRVASVHRTRVSDRLAVLDEKLGESGLAPDSRIFDLMSYWLRPPTDRLSLSPYVPPFHPDA